DEYLTIPQLRKRYPGTRGAQHLATSTVTRWIIKGCPTRDGRRVKLAALRCGWSWLVRPADLDTFFAALAAGPADAPTDTKPTPSQAKLAKAAARAHDRLSAAGA